MTRTFCRARSTGFSRNLDGFPPEGGTTSASLFPCLALVLTTLTMSGCAGDNAGQGALLGGLFGAGAGRSGRARRGQHRGRGRHRRWRGALTGAAIGASEDEQEANARAAAQAQAVAAAVTVPDVVSMTQARLDERLIIDRIHTRGIVAPLQTNDIIYLHQQGVSDNVIAAMESQPVATAMVQPPPYYYYAPPPDTVYIGGGYYYDHPRYYEPGPRVGIGFGWR